MNRWLLLLALVMSPACAADPTPDAIAGAWTVVGHRAPGISAMTQAEADALIGAQARFGSDEVSFGTYRCESPSFTEGAMTENDFLDGFRISRRSLEITHDTVPTVGIMCRDSMWIAPGSFVLVDGDRLLTFWEGVAFELRKESDVR